MKIVTINQGEQLILPRRYILVDLNGNSYDESAIIKMMEVKAHSFDTYKSTSIHEMIDDEDVFKRIHCITVRKISARTFNLNFRTNCVKFRYNV